MQNKINELTEINKELKAEIENNEKKFMEKAGIYREEISKLKENQEELKNSFEADRTRIKGVFNMKIEELTQQTEKLANDYSTVSIELRNKDKILKELLDSQENVKRREENLKKTKITVAKLKNAFESLEVSFACSNCSSTDSDLVLLHCGHSVCENCLGNSDSTVRCERCKINTEKSLIEESQMIKEISVKFRYARQCLSELDVFPV